MARLVALSFGGPETIWSAMTHIACRALALFLLVGSTNCISAEQWQQDPIAGGAAVWSGGSGNWSNPVLWGQNHSADPTINGVYIDFGHPASSWVNLDLNANLQHLTIDDGDTLNVLNGRAAVFDDPHSRLCGAGTLRLEGAWLPTYLGVESGSTLSVHGGMRIELHNGLGVISGWGDESRLEIHDSSIHGAGLVGSASLAIVNDGLIDADVLYKFLALSSSPDGITNSGELRASNGGRLRLSGNAILNSGVIAAHAGSRVDLDGALVRGGTLRTLGNGLLRVQSSEATIDDVRIEGVLELGPTRLTLRGAIENLGTMQAVAADTIAGPGKPVTAFSEIVLPAESGNVLLSGSGRLNLRATKIHSGSTALGGVLTNGPDHTIAGDGLLGSGTIGVLNQGSIIADRPTLLLIDTSLGEVFVNSGSIRAEGEGGVTFTNGEVRNEGVIEALPGSKVFYTATASESQVSFGALTGGTWRVIAGESTASITLSAPGVIFNEADVLLSGQGSSFGLMNTIQVNSGRFALDHGRMFTTQGTTFVNEGTLEIGESCAFNTAGTFSQAARGMLRVVLGQPPQGAPAAALNVNGVASLGGALEIVLADGYVPQNGEVLHLIDAQAVQGAFGVIVAPPGIDVSYTVGAVAININGFCPGDLDGNGAIDQLDIGALLGQWGLCPVLNGACMGDLNADGVINQADVQLLLTMLGGCS